MYNQSASEARKTKIYVIDHENLTIDDTTLYDWVMKSQTEVTSPRGVMPKFFIEYNEESEVWELKEWLAGVKLSIIDSFVSEQAAEDDLFTRTYNCEFLNDDSRDTRYFTSEKDAENELWEAVIYANESNIWDSDKGDFIFLPHPGNVDESGYSMSLDKAEDLIKEINAERLAAGLEPAYTSYIVKNG